jgi:hypothetical protein
MLEAMGGLDKVLEKLPEGVKETVKKALPSNEQQ